MNLLSRIESYLDRTAIAPTRFGREFAGDPRFVLDLRRGRIPRRRLRARLVAFLDRVETDDPGLGAA